jgi:hypothetical protein
MKDFTLAILGVLLAVYSDKVPNIAIIGFGVSIAFYYTFQGIKTLDK